MPGYSRPVGSTAETVAINPGGNVASTTLQQAILELDSEKAANNDPRFYLPSGMLAPFAGSTAPSGWLLCYGQAISRTTYADLFTAIGTTHGVGDGSTTFNLPDMRGRAPIGKDDMGGSAANRITNAVSGITGTTLGATGGDQNAHQHTHSWTGSAVTSAAGSTHTHTFTGTSNQSTGNVSSDHSHNFSGSTSTTGNHNHAPPVTVVYNGNAGNARSLFATNYAFWSNGDWNNATSINGDHAHNYSGTTSGISANHTHTITPAGTNSNESAHTHSVTANGTNANANSGISQNIQPSIVLNYIIKT